MQHRRRTAQSVLTAAFVSAGASLIPSPTTSQELARYLLPREADCPGELGVTHTGTHPWNLATNSLRPKSQDPTRFIHCVFNNGPGVVEVNWRIPQVIAPVPSKKNAVNTRFSRDGEPIDKLDKPDGCLVYGNAQKKATLAQFWARADDKQAVADEKGRDCLTLKTASISASSGATVAPRQTVAPFRTYLPSKPTSPTESLVAFEGITGVRAVEPTRYESFLVYQLRPEPGGQAAAISDEYAIEPRWQGPTEALAAFFNKEQAGRVIRQTATETPATISFVVTGPGRWAFHELEYQLRDRTGKVAAKLFAPVYVPIR